MPLQRYSPSELAAKHAAVRAAVSARDFFSSPKCKKPQEEWCAAKFSQAYEEFFHPCAVLLEIPDPQNEIDFYLEVGSDLHKFQITECLEPDRRRGTEYSSHVPGLVRGEDWSEGTQKDPEWIEAAVAKKLRKYGSVGDLNLLVYVNIPTYELPFATVQQKCASASAHYSSVWLLTGEDLCCLKSNPALGVLNAWLRIGSAE